jgi:hypothetical protein
VHGWISCRKLRPRATALTIFALEFDAQILYGFFAHHGPHGENMSLETRAEIHTAKQLTLKALGCEPESVVDIKETRARMPLAHIYGIASRFGFQEDSRGTGRTYTFFIGNFEGTNLQTGEQLQSNKLYLPDTAAEKLEATMAAAQRKLKNSTVDFAFEIASVKNENSHGGYSYDVKDLLKPETSDPLERVRELSKEHWPKSKPENKQEKKAS